MPDKKKKNTSAEEVKEANEVDEVNDNPEVVEKSQEDILKEKVAELEDKYVRLLAEYDNYKKRTQKEKEARYTDALVDVVEKILPVGDNLERAISTETECDEAKKIIEGVVMVYKQFEDILAKLDVFAIDTQNQKFDPNLHNAVMHIEDENLDENVIAEELMKGYIYKDSRVVRHSMVKVAN